MKKQRSSASSGVLALILLAAWFGLTPVVARYLAADNGLFEQWYLRFGIAFVASLVIFRRRIQLKKFLRLPTKEWLILLVRVLSMSVVAVALYTVAAQNAKIGPVSFMQAVPVMTLLAVVLFHEKLTRRKGALVLISFIGVVLVAVDNPHDLLDFNSGEIYSLISGVFFAFAFLTRKWHTGVLNNQEITVAMLGLAFVINYILSVVLYQRIFASTSEWTLQFVIVLFFAGVTAVGSFFLQNYGFEHVSGVIASSILNLEQVFGPLFGFVFYHEGLAFRELIGGVVILVAALTMSQLSRKETQAVPAPD